jgi:hypothetical protein
MFGLFNRKRRFRSLPQTLLTDSAGAMNDSFGHSVSLSGDGNTALVGARLDDVGANNNQGSATVFVRTSSTSWTQQTKLTDSTGGANDQFGYDVALSNNGNTAIIGAPYDTVGANANQGSATIFTRSSSTWTEQIKITHPSGAANSNFGFGVAISSDGLRAAVGRITQVGAQLPSVRIYFYNGSSWVFEQELTTPSDDDGRDNTGFGTSVAFNDTADTLIVGAAQWDGGAGSGNDNTGAAIIYTRSGTTWTHQATLKASVPTMTTNGAFGQCVALSGNGNLALIGAPNEDVDFYEDAQGTATVYTRSGSTWTKEATLVNGSGSYVYFGNGLALSNDGNTALIGAWTDFPPGSAVVGSASVFTRLNGVWTKQIKIFNDLNIGGYGAFGISVSLSNNGKTGLIGDNTINVGATTSQGSAKVIYRR